MSSKEETEPPKRDNKRKDKKEEDGGAGKRAREEHEGPADGSGCSSDISAADEEVDKFFAILRRMRVAVSYFGMNDGSNYGREIIGCVGKQAPVESEMNRGGGRVESVDIAAVRVESVEENTGFDLNLDPVSEPDPVLGAT